MSVGIIVVVTAVIAIVGSLTGMYKFLGEATEPIPDHSVRRRILAQVQLLHRNP